MNSKKNLVPRQIAVLSIFSIVLNFIYLVWSDSLFSLYILWNIFLAFIPFFVSLHLLKYRNNGGKNWILYFAGIFVWLFFFPNAPYLITDIIHVGESIGVPLWFDAITLFVSAWVGILFSIYSLSHVESLLLTKYSKKISTILIFLAVLFSSFGIYLGRFLRWNSWDIIIHPTKIFSDIWLIFSKSNEYGNVYFFVLVFLAFILVSYYSWKSNGNESH